MHTDETPILFVVLIRVYPCSSVAKFCNSWQHASAHKRKTLRNNLAGIYGHAVDEWPEAGLRAEQIPLEGFVEMFERVVNWPRMNTDAHG